MSNQTSNGAPKFSGAPYTLNDGRTIVIPEFNVDEGERYLEKRDELQLEVMSRQKSPQPDDRKVLHGLTNDLLGIIHLAVLRNYPEMSFDEFKAGIGYKRLPEIGRVVGLLNEFVVDESGGGSDPSKAAPGGQ